VNTSCKETLSSREIRSAAQREGDFEIAVAISDGHRMRGDLDQAARIDHKADEAQSRAIPRRAERSEEFKRDSLRNYLPGRAGVRACVALATPESHAQFSLSRRWASVKIRLENVMLMDPEVDDAHKIRFLPRNTAMGLV
jgi:hypothetical protein